MTRALFDTAQARDPNADLEEDFRVLGIDPASMPPPEAEEGGIWPQHVPAVRAFLAVSRQWRTAQVGRGGLKYIGLDYGAAKAGLELAGIEVTPAQWAEVRVIEVGALDALNGDGS